MLDRQQALQFLDVHLSNAKKRRHAVAVAAVMKGLAKRLGKDETEWELVGLLHDLDYDLTQNDTKKHGVLAAEILTGQLSNESLHAIQAHDYRTGVKPVTVLDKALIASDCFWFLLVRVALINFEGRMDRVKPGSLRVGFENRSFPPFLKSGIAMCRDLGLTVAEFLETALNAFPSGLTIETTDV